MQRHTYFCWWRLGLPSLLCTVVQRFYCAVFVPLRQCFVKSGRIVWLPDCGGPCSYALNGDVYNIKRPSTLHLSLSLLSLCIRWKSVFTNFFSHNKIPCSYLKKKTCTKHTYPFCTFIVACVLYELPFCVLWANSYLWNHYECSTVVLYV